MSRKTRHDGGQIRWNFAQGRGTADPTDEAQRIVPKEGCGAHIEPVDRQHLEAKSLRLAMQFATREEHGPFAIVDENSRHNWAHSSMVYAEHDRNVRHPTPDAETVEDRIA